MVRAGAELAGTAVFAALLTCTEMALAHPAALPFPFCTSFSRSPTPCHSHSVSEFAHSATPPYYRFVSGCSLIHRPPPNLFATLHVARLLPITAASPYPPSLPQPPSARFSSAASAAGLFLCLPTGLSPHHLSPSRREEAGHLSSAGSASSLSYPSSPFLHPSVRFLSAEGVSFPLPPVARFSSAASAAGSIAVTQPRTGLPLG